MSDLKMEFTVKKISIDCQELSVITHLFESESIDLLGNEDLLKGFKVGLLCSTKCPGEIVLKSLNLLHKSDRTAFCLVSGFHSPLERECYSFMINSQQKMIICPARNISKMRLNKEMKEALIAQRIAIVSPFSEKFKATSRKNAWIRNMMVAALADRVLVFHAAPNGMTEKLIRTIINWGKKVYTIDSKDNDHLIKFGVNPINRIEDLNLAGFCRENIPG